MPNTRQRQDKSQKRPSKNAHQRRQDKKRKERKKRERQRKSSLKYRKKVASNPEKYEAFKERDRARKAKARQEGKIKRISDLNAKERSEKRAKMREYMQMYRKKQKGIDGKLTGSPAAVSLSGSEDNLTHETHPFTGAAFFTSTPESQDNLPEPSENSSESHESSLTHPSTCSTASTSAGSTTVSQGSRQRTRGRMMVRKDRARVYKQNQMLVKQNAALQKEVWRLRKRMFRRQSRIRSPQMTPKSKFRKISRGQFLNENVKKNLFKGLVLVEECKAATEGIKKCKKAKTVFSRVMNGKIIKKYKMLNQFKKILPPFSNLKARKEAESENNSDVLDVEVATPQSVLKKRKAIQDFFASSEASHCAPGKKDFVKINGEQVQKQYLNDTMSALYRKFLQKSDFVVSYAMLCQYRPKYVVAPKLSSRDTCLCIKCSNFKLLASLRCKNVIEEKNPNDVLKTLCCNVDDDACLFRSCQTCKAKGITFNVVDKNEKIMFRKWGSAKTENKKQPGAFMKITQKQEIEKSVGEAVDLFQVLTTEYMAHIGRVKHQSQAMKDLESKLTSKDLAVSIDWSENWQCKYHEEVQSVHFGGSHQQLSLHTGIVKSSNFAQTFCTVSDYNDHGPKAIYAHTKPILERFASEETERLHFNSDGPTTQYRNSKMFKIVAEDISALLPNVKQITWNFSKSGHGKGIPDGVGGTAKRTADNAIAHGADITDVNSFVKEISIRCPKIFVRLITDSEMKEAQKINVDKLTPFKGTFKVHQYHWSKENPKEITFKSLSCYKCESFNVCNHFTMGKWKLPELDNENESRSNVENALASVRKAKPLPKKVVQKVKKAVVVKQANPEPRRQSKRLKKAD